MTRSRFAVFALIVAVAALLLFTPSGRVASQALEQVFVTNFPDPQTVDGTVGIEGPVLQSHMVTFRQITVPPVGPADTTRLVDGGLLSSDGFPAVVLSLHGTVKGDAVLIPIVLTAP